MLVIISDDGKRAALRLRGELDIATAPLMIEEVTRRWQEAQETTLDLAGISFIDSTGIRALLELARRSEQERRTITLCNISPQVRRVIRLAGVESTLPLAHERPA